MNAPKPRRAHLEEDEQALVVQWAALKRTEFGPLIRHVFSIPNGAYLAGSEKKRGAQMARLQRVGLRVGAADLFVALPRRQWHGLYVEMKRPRVAFRSRREAETAVSSEQRTFGEDMLEAGYAWVVAYGFDEAKKVIEAYVDGHEPMIRPTAWGESSDA